MTKEIIFQMKSTYRDDFKIEGYRFGSGENTLCIVGTMRGDEVQQQYVCAQIVRELQRIEASGNISEGKSVLVIPSCNPFSMNVGRRFWAMDGTDINRMFPGYDQGETTQRIAAAVFKDLEGFRYGVQLASFYVPGEFVPHMRMLKTGYEDIEGAKRFGMPYVTVRRPLPFDTTLLNYNWQIWNTSAFSLYAGHTDSISTKDSEMAVAAVVRFMDSVGVVGNTIVTPGYSSVFVDEDNLVSVTAHHAGLYVRQKMAGDTVMRGEVMAVILHPYDGSVLEEVRSPQEGIVFFSHHRPLVLQNALLYRIIVGQ